MAHIHEVVENLVHWFDDKVFRLCPTWDDCEMGGFLTTHQLEQFFGSYEGNGNKIGQTNYKQCAERGIGRKIIAKMLEGTEPPANCYSRRTNPAVTRVHLRQPTPQLPHCETVLRRPVPVTPCSILSTVTANRQQGKHMKAAIGYVRVSSESQVDGVSLEMQTKKIRAWCDLHDHPLLTVYEDAGISGKTAEGRPGLQAAIEACSKGNVLVVYSLSRLARSAMDALNTRNRLEKKGAAFVSITESLDTSTSLGRMVFTVLAAFAEFERDEIVSRVKAGMKQTKERGELVGSVPFGYSLASDRKTLVANIEEQRVIISARQLRASGLSLRAIAAGLDKAGHRSRNGKVFDPKQIARLVA